MSIGQKTIVVIYFAIFDASHCPSGIVLLSTQTIGGSLVVNDGFVGCARDFRLGKSENAILAPPKEKFNIILGCTDTDDCSKVDCPRNR